MKKEEIDKWRRVLRNSKPLVMGFVLIIFFIVCVVVELVTLHSSLSNTPTCQGSTPGIASPTPAVVASPVSAVGTSPGAVSVGVSAIGPAPLAPSFADASQGYIFETVDGQTLQQLNEDRFYHPASTIKLATALFALHSLGPDYVFETRVSISGTVQDGVLKGNLYVSGDDPSLRLEHGVELARQLNFLGIKRIAGFVVVEPGFTYNGSFSTIASGKLLRDTLDRRYRSCRARDAFNRTYGAAADQFSVENDWGAIGGIAPFDATLMVVHRSAPLVAILKAMLCYSDNFMAERLGSFLGGPAALQLFLTSNLGSAVQNIHVGSTSGLGANWITPKGMMLVLRALIDQLDAANLSLTDLAPVAGIDEGTLQHRYTARGWAGSVVAKTGTLIQTQGGVSALVGEFVSAQGRGLFVIFDRRGNVPRFRAHQDELVKAMQNKMGGPALLGYQRQKLAITMRPNCLRTNCMRTCG